MIPSENPCSSGPTSRPERPWHYWRPAAADVVEAGTVQGTDVSLPTHFHLEDQTTIVLSGRRRFVIDSEIIEVVAGSSVRIPAGTPHRSLAEPSGVLCINLYTSAYLAPALPSLSELVRSCIRLGSYDWLGNPSAPRQLTCPSARPVLSDSTFPASFQKVGQAAHLSGMSREHYSRKFRKLHGIAPREFRLLDRLNHARGLLRVGETIGAAAAEAGFSDQSHLGRYFRRFFGITPGAYRTGDKITSVL